MTVNVDIEVALITKLTELIPQASMQLENDAPPAATDVAYYRVTVLQGSPSNPVFGGNFYRIRGYMQVDLMYPLNEGSGDTKLKAGEIREMFPRGLSLTQGGATVIIDETPDIGPGSTDGDRYKIIVKIRFFANVEG